VSEANTEYDSPWKQLLETYFEAFIGFFFPDASRQIDWTQPVEFLDKELQQVVRDAELGKRLVDKLVKVHLADGSAAWAGRAHDIARFDTSTFVPLADTTGRPVAAPRLIARAQDLWLVGYVTPTASGRLFYGLLDWAEGPKVHAIRDQAGLRDALARIGFA